MLEVELNQVGKYKFEVTNPFGYKAAIDGTKEMGGTEQGFRPMETLLAGLAGCSSFDVIHILEKTRQNLEGLSIKVQGHRREEVPSIFNKIHVVFIAKGDVDEKQLHKACSLSMEKYCSVAHMLEKSAEITFESRVEN